jgi:hypothetical protein
MKLKLAIVLALLLPAALFSHSITLAGGAQNFLFDQTTADLPPAAGVYQPPLGIMGSLRMEGEFSDFITYDAVVQYGDFWRDYFWGKASFNLWAFKFGVGTMIGYKLDDTSPLQFNLVPGVSGSVGIQAPGYFFLEGETAVSFGDVVKEGDYSREFFEVRTGFWVPHVITTLSYSRKKLLSQATDTDQAEDLLTRYMVNFDIFSKDIYFTIHLFAGYEIMQRTRIVSGTAGTPTEIAALFAGVEAYFRLNWTLDLFLHAEVPISLTDARFSSVFFFRGFAGVRIHYKR